MMCCIAVQGWREQVGMHLVVSLCLADKVWRVVAGKHSLLPSHVIHSSGQTLFRLLL